MNQAKLKAQSNVKMEATEANSILKVLSIKELIKKYVIFNSSSTTQHKIIGIENNNNNEHKLCIVVAFRCVLIFFNMYQLNLRFYIRFCFLFYI